MPRTVCFGPSMIYSMPRTEDHAPACNQTRKRQLFAEFATLPTFPRLIINQGIIKIHLIFHKSLKSSASTAAPWPTPTTRPTAWPTVWGHASHHVGMCRASCVTSCVLSTASLSNRTFLLSGPSVGTTPLSAPAPSLPSPTRCTSRSRGTDAFLCRTSTIPSFCTHRGRRRRRRRRKKVYWRRCRRAGAREIGEWTQAGSLCATLWLSAGEVIIHTHTQTHTDTHTHTCVCVCLCVYVYVCECQVSAGERE